MARKKALLKRVLVAALMSGALAAWSGGALADEWECRKGMEDPNRFEAHSFSFEEESVEISELDRVTLEGLAEDSLMLSVVCVMGVISYESDEMDHEDLMLRRAQAVAQVMIEYGAQSDTITVATAEHKFSQGRFDKYFDKNKDGGATLVEVLFIR